MSKFFISDEIVFNWEDFVYFHYGGRHTSYLGLKGCKEIPILQELTHKKFKEEIIEYENKLNREEKLIKEVEKLKTHISLMPEGELYLQAQENFISNISKC
jgi:hypothetical protein